MTYKEATDYLFNSTPLFQNVGKDAYKEGLDNTLALDEHFGHPHKKFKTIHVAGTNGKGSCSHTLAAILQSAGYKVGLYTSPHLTDFRERIRINGEMISEEEVISFVVNERYFFEPLNPSFFELTTSLAFSYFAKKNVDVAVIEVGLGGRLDCTNIITPEISIITNISFDHIQFLGNTIEKIAKEKAGIIKPGVPVVIGESDSESKPVFLSKAKECKSDIYFAEDVVPVHADVFSDSQKIYVNEFVPNLNAELCGLCQEKNTSTILTAVKVLQNRGLKITEDNIRKGFAHVCGLTGLRGRWQILAKTPLIICDTGHNVGGIKYIVEQLKTLNTPKLHMIIGMVNDKDIDSVLSLLPKDAVYYFTKASVKRALDENMLHALADKKGLHGYCFKTVKMALDAARMNAASEDVIFVGGSTFIVADLLAEDVFNK